MILVSMLNTSVSFSPEVFSVSILCFLPLLFSLNVVLVVFCSSITLLLSVYLLDLTF